MSGLHCFQYKHAHKCSARWAVDQSALECTEFDIAIFDMKVSPSEVNPIRSRVVSSHIRARDGIDVMYLNSTVRVLGVPPEAGPREALEENDSLNIFASTQTRSYNCSQKRMCLSLPPAFAQYILRYSLHHCIT